jgi:hypothetical protein
VAVMDRKFDEDALMKSVELSDLSGLEKLRKIFSYCVKTKESDDDDEFTHIWLMLLEDPKFLSQHFVENRASGLEWFIPILKEGMKDGSIKKQDADVLAELINLHLNIWLMPTIYPGEVDYAKKKLKISREILEFVGCPIVDDKLEEVLIEFIEYEIQWKKKP